MGRSSSRHARDGGGDGPSGGGRGLSRALALTLASALVWGVAHVVTGRRIAGSLLLALWAAIAAALAAAATVYRSDLLHLAVQPDVVQRVAAALVAFGVLWILVVIRSYQILRPLGMSISAKTLGAASVAVMCFAVGVPVAWSAHSTYVYRDALTSIFRTGSENGKKVDTEDPFNGQARVNILLLGGDAAADRTGVRTDSMTLASVDTETGDTVLLSLPRNLERFQMPPGPARDRFPYGFTGDGPLNPGLLNEVYEYAEQHPDVVPGVPKNHRGPELLKATIAGYRKLGGKEALWYGRSRTNSSDYVRMGRQKCLMRAIAEQADPQTVLTSFDKLAAAAKRTLATDIPQELLPALVKLSNKVKDGAGIRSLQFVPPLIYTGNPDFKLIRKLASEAVNSDPRAVSASGSPSASPSGPESPSSGSPGTSSSPKPDTKPVSLEDSCP